MTAINPRGSADLDNASMAASRPFGSISMIKEIIVDPEHLAARDPARDFPIGINESFAAHVAGMAVAECGCDLTGVNAAMGHGV